MRRTPGPVSLAALASLAGDADVVIGEGFKAEAPNKIEVFRSGISGAQPLCLSDRSITAIVSSAPVVVSIPRFDWNDAAAVSDFIIAKLQL
jgi:molybdopterin-guanine dinucleotide biosynthesis protein B